MTDEDAVAAARKRVLTLPGVVITTVEADLALQDALAAVIAAAEQRGREAERMKAVDAWVENFRRPNN